MGKKNVQISGFSGRTCGRMLQGAGSPKKAASAPSPKKKK